MARGENIGGINPETKTEFKIRQLQGKWPNHEVFMKRLLELYDRYNDQYEAELNEKRKR